MEQQQQGYPPVGSVWHRTETDGTVTRRFVTTQWNGPDSVSFRENSDPHSTSVSLDMWHKWVRGVLPARMVVPGDDPPLSRFAETNFAAAVEVNRELSRKLVVAKAEKNLAEMTLNSQTKKLEEAERLLRESRSREGNLINDRDIAVGRLRNEASELHRKLEVAEKQLHAARQDSLNLTLEARDAPELRRKLAEEVGKVIQLLGERDKAIADREATDKALAAACADHVRQLDALKTERLAYLNRLDCVVRERDRLHSELRDVSQQAGLAHNEKLKHQLGALEVNLKVANEEKFVQYERLRDAREMLCQAISIIDGVEQKG